MDEAVREGWRAGRDAWPEIELEDGAFRDHLNRVPSDPGGADLHWADLYLAAACARGIPAALRALEATYGAALDAAAHGFGARHGQTDSLRQLLRTHFLAPRAGGPPRIADYRGQGPLEGWLRVGATRRLVDETRRRTRQEPEQLRDDDWLERQCAEDHAELHFLKERYRDAFRRAFAEAAGKLSPEQRNYLRYQTRDGLTLDQIAAMHGQHRSSVDRRIRAARELLLRETRSALAAELNAGTAEVDSVLRLIQSRMDASISRLLQA